MENRYQESNIEGRNAVLEAFRSGRTVDKLFVLEHCEDGPVRTILREAKKQNTIVKFVKKERLDQMSQTGMHQGVIAQTAAYAYAQVEDILEAAQKKGSRLSFLYWITLKIPTIWGPLSVRPIWQEPTV